MRKECNFKETAGWTKKQELALRNGWQHDRDKSRENNDELDRK